jgi:type VI secretion system protein
MLPLVVQVERTVEHVADTCAFKQSPVRLGRNPLNDLQLEEGFVSQWHAVVRFNEKRTTYLDLGSTNRTLIDGKPIDRNIEVEVDENTDIRIGTLRLHLLRAPAPDDLFGRRRKSAFMPTGVRGPGELSGETMFLSGKSNMHLPGSPELLPTGLRPVMAEAEAAAGPSNIPPSISGRIQTPRPPAGAAQGTAVPQSGPVPRAVSSRPLHATGDAMADGYASYRDGWGAFFVAIRRVLEGTPPEKREEQVLQMQTKYPELAALPAFRAYLREIGIDPMRVGHPEMEDWLRRLTGGVFPPPGNVINIALAMERVGEILEIFSQAFIELRRVHEQFCRELSLERYSEDNTMQRTEDSRALLSFLLNPEKEGVHRPGELSRALADFAVHQVAVVSAVVEGGRAMLEQLTPEAVSKLPDPQADAPALQQAAAFDKAWPFAARKLWRKYLVQYHHLREADRFTHELFGRAFARRYYAITGAALSSSKS